MSERDWLHMLGRLNFAAGILAAKGDQYDALYSLISCVDVLEQAVHKRAHPELISPQVRNALETAFLNLPNTGAQTPTAPLLLQQPWPWPPPVVPVFENYTVSSPCPDQPAPSGTGPASKARRGMLGKDARDAYHAEHDKPKCAAESSVCSSMARSARAGRRQDRAAADEADASA